MTTTAIERQQRGLLNLIKNRGSLPDDSYLQRVAGSRELAMLRTIALWWRALQLEANCRYTSRLLRRVGCFDATVAEYFSSHTTSPFVEELSEDFLHTLRSHPDPLISAVSALERALLRTRDGSDEIREIVWDRHPDRVIEALQNGSALPASEGGRVYRMRVCRNIPNVVECVRVIVGPELDSP